MVKESKTWSQVKFVFVTKYLEVFVRMYYGYCLAAITLTAFCKSDSLEFISLLRWRSLPMLIYSLQKVIYFSTRSAVDHSLWWFCSHLRINKIANAFSSYFIFKHFYQRFFFFFLSIFLGDRSNSFTASDPNLYFSESILPCNISEHLILYFYVQVFLAKINIRKNATTLVW